MPLALLHQSNSLKDPYEVKRISWCFAGLIFHLPRGRPLSFKPTSAPKHLFCQGRTGQHTSRQVCLTQGRLGWPAEPQSRSLGRSRTVTPKQPPLVTPPDVCLQMPRAKLTVGFGLEQELPPPCSWKERTEGDRDTGRAAAGVGIHSTGHTHTLLCLPSIFSMARE